ncbi:MAG: D-2-hydroxyacid dehydrogenase [Pseudomonadales bacterium]|nr:D-2-hydroxyacid dehydrogenase [Pseudomonadales bacterium]
MKIVIIPGLTLPEIPDTHLQRIKDIVGPTGEVIITRFREAPEHIVDADVILGIINRDLFLQTKNLAWVHAIASGVDMFLFPEFKASDVILTSEKGLVGEHLADHGMGLLLMLTRQLAASLRYGTASWDHRPEMRHQEVELTGLTMGLVGYGGTGKAMAKRASAFGMKCIAVDHMPMPGDELVNEVWSNDRLGELLAASDVVNVGCPLTPATRNLFNAETFSQMKDSAFLVNVTRGEVMEEQALIDALQNGQIRGAALDVVPQEPLPADHPLWQMDNVVMTPHTAGASQFRGLRNLERFITNLQNLIDNKPLAGVIDKELGF